MINLSDVQKQYIPQILRVVRIGMAHSGPLDDAVCDHLEEWRTAWEKYAEEQGLVDPHTPALVVSSVPTGANSDEERLEMHVLDSNGGFGYNTVDNDPAAHYQAIRKYLRVE